MNGRKKSTHVEVNEQINYCDREQHGPYGVRIYSNFFVIYSAENLHGKLNEY